LSMKPPEDLRAGLVSVGLPVYNGARYLRETLDSLLAQTYPDYEIIISDNASEDETEAICREYAARDPRVRYHRAEQNMGPFWNYNRAYELARGEYFMWNAHDDLRDPRCLSLCVEALRQNPNAVMCCMGTKLIDEGGRELPDDLFLNRIYHPTGATARERLRSLARSRIGVDYYSLFRTPVIAATRHGKIKVWGGDTVFTAEVCMLGDVVAVPEKLFYYRLFQAKTPEEMAATLNGWGANISASWLGLVAELLEAIRLAPLGRLEKMRLKWTLATEMCVRDPHWRFLIVAEGFRGLRAALRGREYRRALRLAGLGLLSQSRPAFQRLKNSVRYRAGRLKHLLLHRGAAPQ
jgi:glycosyltransferase involved in cell wall biosynthesis